MHLGLGLGLDGTGYWLQPVYWLLVTGRYWLQPVSTKPGLLSSTVCTESMRVHNYKGVDLNTSAMTFTSYRASAIQNHNLSNTKRIIGNTVLTAQYSRFRFISRVHRQLSATVAVGRHVDSFQWMIVWTHDVAILIV